MVFGSGERFQLGNLLGSGSFGEVYAGKDRYAETGNGGVDGGGGVERGIPNPASVAIKLEPLHSKHAVQLPKEKEVLDHLEKYNVPNVPRAIWFGTRNDYNVMVIPRLGYTLETIKDRFPDRRIPEKTIAYIALQTLSVIESVHATGIMHRDLKPENFMTDRMPFGDRIFIIDFGLAKRWRHRNGQHIPEVRGKKLTGTLRYASINTHFGIEQSRRDDLESLAYVWVYLCKGVLPWQGIKVRSRSERDKRITDRKTKTPTNALCRGMHPAFEEYLNTVRKLGFEEAPDYDKLKAIISKIPSDNGAGIMAVTESRHNSNKNKRPTSAITTRPSTAVH